MIPCDRCVVLVHEKGVGILVGNDAEDEPRELLVLGPNDTGRLIEELEAALAGIDALSCRRRHTEAPT